jgi:hypothetical protein
MKLTSMSGLAVAAILVSTLVNAQGPARSQGPIVNVDPNTHFHLAAAQDLVNKAWNKIADAKNYQNDVDTHGHAQKAMDLLVVVNNEIAAAAERRN